MTLRGQISWALVSIFCLPLYVGAQDLALDETGPTAPEAVSVDTMDEDYLLPTYSLPAAPISVMPEVEAPSTMVIPENIDILTEIFGPDPVTLSKQKQPTPAVMPSKPVQTKTFTPMKQGTVNTAGTLLTPLDPLPEPMVIEEEEVPPYTPYVKQSDTADQVLNAMKNGKNLKFMMPREIRVKFYPGQAVFSSQVLKWVKAFSLKVLSDPRYHIEIRASSIDWPLQSKRVALLVHAMMEQGVSRHQIQVYQSERDENSVTLGCATETEEEQQTKGKKQKTLMW